MGVEVRETRTATRQADALRGRTKRTYDRFLDDLAAAGCGALGYRLTGPDPLPRLCVKHLYGEERVVVAFPAPDVAWIVLVGPHRDDDPGRNVYDLLYAMAGQRPDDLLKRTKPPCCSTEDGPPPPFSMVEVDDLVARSKDLAR